MEKIEDSTHYHNVLKFEELEAALTAEEARMNPDPVAEEANIVRAAKGRSNQRGRGRNNQGGKSTNSNDQSNSQSNQNSGQSQRGTASRGRGRGRGRGRFSNNRSNNTSSTDPDKRPSQDTEKSMMTRILSTEPKEPTEFAKILNRTAQPTNKPTEWLADTGATCHITNSPDYFVNPMSCSRRVGVANDESMLGTLVGDVRLTLSLPDGTEKRTLFKDVLYCREASCNLFSIGRAVLNDVEFKINNKGINFTNENGNSIGWADFKNCHFYLRVNELTSSSPTNLAYIAETGAKLEGAELGDAKSVKDDMTDQQQNSD